MLLLVAAAARAQLNESITVSYVEVPVTVVDRAGNPVRGLTQANFELVDEGKKLPITGFEAIDFAAPPSNVRVSVRKKGSDAVQTASVAVVP
jgi:hypothetical protein